MTLMPKILSAKDFRSMPWKNGGGTTCELFRLAHPLDNEKFVLRLSMAQVSTDGPFSFFPGIDRTLLLLSGHGFRLSFPDEVEVVLDLPFVPLHFSGEDAIHCKLIDGPCTDFNVMIDPQWGQAQTQVTQAQKFVGAKMSFIFDPADQQLVVLNKGETWERETSTTVIAVDVHETY